MATKLTVLCIPLSGLGHMNATLGLCEGIRSRGHKVVFAVERSWKRNFAKHGFDEQLYDEREIKDGEEDGKYWCEFFEKVSPYFRGDYEFNANITKLAMSLFTDIVIYSNDRIKEIVESVKPDVIIQDNYATYPAIVKSGVPYAQLCSANPLVALSSPNLPPIDSSEPIDDPKNWRKLTQIRIKAVSETWNSFNKWLVDQGIPELQEGRFQHDSPYLNILLYPKVLFEDYAKRVSLGDNWMLLEHAVRIKCTSNEFLLPEPFLAKPGKIVYVSMGSMATSDLNLMQHLVNILSKSKHKFVISLGKLFDGKQLAANMWGDKLVPQLEVLKIADLFITHGGNNSVTESLYFGVPMIVMPLFNDQHSNAQRIAEMKFGAKVNPFTIDEDELLHLIDLLSTDDNLHQRLQFVSTEIKNSNSLGNIVSRIEQINAFKLN